MSLPPPQLLANLKLPPPKRQLAMEIESFSRNIKKLEKEGRKKDDANISIMLNEVSTRMNLYDQQVGFRYIAPPDAQRTEKLALSKIFTGLQGHSWSRKLGWVGQPKVVKRPEVMVFEAEASLYEGVQMAEIAVGASTVFTVTGLSLSGVGCEGVFPPEICNLSNLQTLILSNNIISGTIPKRFAGLTSLKKLL